MLAVETGVPRLFPLNGIFTAATPCETIKKPVSSFGGSLQTEPLPVKPEISKRSEPILNFMWIKKDYISDDVSEDLSGQMMEAMWKGVKTRRWSEKWLMKFRDSSGVPQAPLRAV